jgi:hypothetical protein
MLGRADQEALLACVREHLAPVHYNGFALDAWYGDWDGSSLTGESQSMIVVCRVAAGRAA